MKDYFKIAKKEFANQKTAKFEKNDIVKTIDPAVPVMKLSSEGRRYETGMTYVYKAIDLDTDKEYDIVEGDIKYKINFPKESTEDGWGYYKKTTIYAQKKHKNIDGKEIVLTRGGFTSIEDITDQRNKLWEQYGRF